MSNNIDETTIKLTVYTSIHGHDLHSAYEVIDDHEEGTRLEYVERDRGSKEERRTSIFIADDDAPALIEALRRVFSFRKQRDEGEAK